MSKKDGRRNNKPPKETQFKKGQSGNPAGRPKQGFNLYDDLHNILNETLISNGEKITAGRAMLKSSVYRSIKGSSSDTKTISRMCEKAPMPYDDAINVSKKREKELHDKIIDLKLQLEKEQEKKAGGVLVVPAGQTPAEWAADAKKFREKHFNAAGDPIEESYTNPDYKKEGT